ncbi:AAA family ATPase [Oerskovia sp. NPDC057915]|uniref:AAA family ATPase n=1 Tax=Oerskovia sp. NPDC057915 TaxID=3346280 RepID=UPI0036DC96E7
MFDAPFRRLGPSLSIVLIAMAGLPGTGKSRLARLLARDLRAVVLSVDPVEDAFLRAGAVHDDVTGLGAYLAVEAAAEENLLLGHAVIVDAVNDHPAARQQWVDLAARAATRLWFVEVYLADEDLHRRRLVTRGTRYPSLPEPGWDSLAERARALAGWTDPRLRLDASLDDAELLAAAKDWLDG